MEHLKKVCSVNLLSSSHWSSLYCAESKTTLKLCRQCSPAHIHWLCTDWLSLQWDLHLHSCWLFSTPTTAHKTKLIWLTRGKLCKDLHYKLLPSAEKSCILSLCVSACNNGRDAPAIELSTFIKTSAFLNPFSILHFTYKNQKCF